MVVAVMLLSTFLNQRGLNALASYSNQQMEEVLPNTFDFLSLQLNVIQIQQWLTDVSATRAQEGFDDGFDEAKVYFDKANKDLERLTQMHAELGEDEMVSNLNSFKKDLQSFYEIGVTMARIYVESGATEGNKLMLKLDPYAEKLSTRLEAWIKVHKQESHDLAEKIKDQTDYIGMQNLSLSIFVIIVALIAAGVINMLLNSISEIDKYLQTIAKLNFRET